MTQASKSSKLYIIIVKVFLRQTSEVIWEGSRSAAEGLAAQNHPPMVVILAEGEAIDKVVVCLEYLFRVLR